MDAAFQLLGTEGWSGTSVRAVCQGARLNPRYFYESFDDLDALVIAVYDRVVEELAAVVLAALGSAAPDPAAQLRATLEATVGFVDDDRRRARVLYVEALGNEALNRRRIDTGHAVATFVQDFSQRPGRGPARGRAHRCAGRVDPRRRAERADRGLARGPGRDARASELIDDATTLFLALGEAAARIAASRTPTNRPGRRRSPA